MRGRQATGKATLSPVARAKNGKTYWVARGYVPVRLGDGTVGSRRVERGFGPDLRSEGQRLAQCTEWNREYEERFRNPWQTITFARAFKNYLGKGHPLPWKAEPIVRYMGEMLCTEINDSVMDDLGCELWPDGVSPKTLNRHLYSPVIAVLNQALKEKAPRLARPKGHREIVPVVIPPEEWYVALYPHLSGDQLAMLLFLAMHGRRISEALARKPADLNPATGVLDLGRTKTGVRVLEVHPKCLPLLMRPGWEKRKWLFGSGPTSANSFRRDMKRACERAGLPWYTPHCFGRHMSVTRMLRRGYSTKHVADAHGMTEAMVATRYGHLSIRETTEALHLVGGDLFDRVFASTPVLTAQVEPDREEEHGGSEGDSADLIASIRCRLAAEQIDGQKEIQE